MSTLDIHAPPTPKASFRGGFARVTSTVLAVIDVFIEAKRQAHEAQQRYPFTAW